MRVLCYDEISLLIIQGVFPVRQKKKYVLYPSRSVWFLSYFYKQVRDFLQMRTLTLWRIKSASSLVLPGNRMRWSRSERRTPRVAMSSATRLSSVLEAARTAERRLRTEDSGRTWGWGGNTGLSRNILAT